ncbi:hypothetical protein CRYUN_Cryun19dG0124200 [Craigia yunnanensis]
MKRKLRHAMRVNKKEQCQMSLDGIRKSRHNFKKFEDCGKEMSKQANERISASKSYLDVGKMSVSSQEVNRRDEMGQAQNFGSGIGSKAASSTESSHRTSNLLTVRHLKGKFHPGKHLSDMLNRGNEDFSRKQTLRTLDRLMSLPEYNMLPALNLGWDKKHEFASPQMRFSPYSNFSTVNGYRRRVQKEKKSGCVSSSLIKDLGAQTVLNNEKPYDRLQSAKKRISGDLSSATKLLQTVYSLGEDLSHKVNQTSVYPRKVMETNHTVRWDEQERNALEVALEPNGVQNTNTNQRTEAVNIFGESEYFECLKLDSPSGDQTSYSSIDVYSSSPLCIQRAEDSDSMIDRAEQPTEPPVEPFCIDIEEFYASSLVESHLDLKSNADQILDSSLFGNVEVWPEKSSTDQLAQQTLQQLVDKDLAKSGTWMDIRLDTEEVVTELVDSILEDLVVDTAIRLQT